MILGPGAAGKSTLAAWLGEITGLPVIELDKRFCRAGLAATSPAQWAAIQRELVQQETWIMDGDLGPYDVLDVRLRAADTVIFLDFRECAAPGGRPGDRGSARTCGAGCGATAVAAAL